MAIILKKDTNSQVIPLGIFVDKSDGVTLETGLTILNSDIQLWKNGASPLVSKNSGGATHIASGVYHTTLDATDTNTLGSMNVYCNMTADALPVKTECLVVPANTYNSLIAGTSNLVVSAGEPTLYSPNTALVKNSSGTLTGDYTKLVSHDDDSISLTENAVDGISLDVIRTSSDTGEAPSLVRVSGYYAGSASHSVYIQVYNYSLAAWETRATMKNRSTPFDYIIPLTSDDSNGSGEMKIRFLHNTITYVPSHVLYLDYVSWEKVSTNNQMQSDIAAIYSLLQDVDNEVDNIEDNALPEILTAVQNIVADVDEDAIADAVWDEALTGHGAAGSAGATLTAASAGAGAGIFPFVYTLTDSVSPHNPIADVYVKVTSDSAGNNTLATGRTNQNGQVTFYLDQGATVYLWRRKSGYDFSNPDEEVVD